MLIVLGVIGICLILLTIGEAVPSFRPAVVLLSDDENPPDSNVRVLVHGMGVLAAGGRLGVHGMGVLAAGGRLGVHGMGALAAGGGGGSVYMGWGPWPL